MGKGQGHRPLGNQHGGKGSSPRTEKSTVPLEYWTKDRVCPQQPRAAVGTLLMGDGMEAQEGMT